MTDGLTCEQVRDRELVERYATGSLGDAEAEALEAHTIECAECWSALQQAVELRAALREPIAAIDVPVGTTRSRRYRWTFGLAAAAALVLAVGGVWYSAQHERNEPTVFRGSSNELTVTAVWQPDGGLRVEWTHLEEATQYRLQLSGSSGREVSRTAAHSTAVIPAADVALLGDLTILVEGETATGEMVGRSALTRISRAANR